MTKPITGGLFAALLLASTGVAQVLPLASNTEGNGDDFNGALLCPLMCRNGRVQQFYELEGGASTLTARSVSLRYDGPTGGPPAEHRIERLTIRIGATARGVNRIESIFDQNLNQPLETAFEATDYRYRTDDVHSTDAGVWGGSDGQLRFVFPTPITVTIPDGGALVLEWIIEGNTNEQGINQAQLDFFGDPGTRIPGANPRDIDNYQPGHAANISGIAITEGQGCPHAPGLAPASITTFGQYDIGTSFFAGGSGYEPNTPVLTLLTTDLLETNWVYPGSSCWIYLDPTTGFIAQTAMANALGIIGGEPPIPLPRLPGLCGTKLYAQNVDLVPDWEFGGLRIVSSNYRTIRVGCSETTVARAWHLSHADDADATVGTLSVSGGLAIRIE